MPHLPPPCRTCDGYGTAHGGPTRIGISSPCVACFGTALPWEVTPTGYAVRDRGVIVGELHNLGDGDWLWSAAGWHGVIDDASLAASTVHDRLCAAVEGETKPVRGAA